ncbi:MAG TPA: hypothetical protein VK432_08010 [Stellaceae bacterium]|nr:hypothetical protein [Stellaceae bacterium]
MLIALIGLILLSVVDGLFAWLVIGVTSPWDVAVRSIALVALIGGPAAGFVLWAFRRPRIGLLFASVPAVVALLLAVIVAIQYNNHPH